jgi:hypothetical protein
VERLWPVTVLGAAVTGPFADPADFERAAGLDELLTDTGLQAGNGHVPEGLALSLHPSDRVLAARVQTFEHVTYSVDYATLLGTGSVNVEAGAGAVLPSSSWTALRIRNGLAVAATGAAVLGAMTVAAFYLGRGAWYAHHGAAGYVFLCGLVGSIAAGAFVGELCLSSAARRRWAIWASAAGGGVAYALIVLLFVGVRPDATFALERLSHGDRAGARETLDAVGAESREDSESARVRDRLRLADIDATDDLQAKVQLFAETWTTDGLQQQAKAGILRSVSAATVSAEQRGDVAALRWQASAIVPLDGPMAANARRALARVTANECINAQRWPCDLPGGLEPELACSLQRDVASRDATTFLEGSEFTRSRQVVDALAALDCGAARAEEILATGTKTLQTRWGAAKNDLSRSPSGRARVDACTTLQKWSEALRSFAKVETAPAVEQTAAMCTAARRDVAAVEEQAQRQAQARAAAEAAQARVRESASSSGSTGSGSSGGCACRDGSVGCCTRGCCSRHGGIAR